MPRFEALGNWTVVVPTVERHQEEAHATPKNVPLKAPVETIAEPQASRCVPVRIDGH